MTLTQFTIGTSRTINLGNFESLRIEASVTFDLDRIGDSLVEATKAAQAELRHLLEETYRAQTKKPPGKAA